MNVEVVVWVMGTVSDNIKIVLRKICVQKLD